MYTNYPFTLQTISYSMCISYRNQKDFNQKIFLSHYACCALWDKNNPHHNNAGHEHNVITIGKQLCMFANILLTP